MVPPPAVLVAANLDALEPVHHGFFTRRGGESEGELASLNCGYSSGDAPEVIAANRARAMASIGLPAASLCTVKQVHGTAVHVARAAQPGPSTIEADALVTDQAGVTLGVLSADCAPVLAVDPLAGIVGAAHAGWRGALAGVVEAMIEAMIGLGAHGDHIKAAVGPCIAKPSYQVGSDMLAAFERQDPSGTSLFEAEPDSERFLFDLKAYVLTRLARSGVKDLTALLQDTLTDEAQFFSARRARSRGRERFGLLLSAIAIEHRAPNVGGPGMRSTASAGNNDKP